MLAPSSGEFLQLMLRADLLISENARFLTAMNSTLCHKYCIVITTRQDYLHSLRATVLSEKRNRDESVSCQHTSCLCLRIQKIANATLCGPY